ncbi:hypothetical protein DV736_g6255, partial [Chaetothyriales sp. CBS 134916]
MRLHLSIQRNALPSVDIVFSTGAGLTSASGSQSTLTIADLLHDVNALVPLESSDGEWGLEDYVVEVAGKQKQGWKRQRREDSHLSSSSSFVESDYTSSSGSDSPFESDSSSSEESEVEPKVTLKKTVQVAGAEFAPKLDAGQVGASTAIPVTLQPSDNSTQMLEQNPPGQGLPRTRKKNKRTRMKKRLKALQETGQLPAHATFVELREYEEAHHVVSTDAPGLVDELEVAKARLLRGIEEMEVEVSPVEARTHDTASSEGREAANGILPRAVEGAPGGLAEETISTTGAEDRLSEQETSPAGRPETSTTSRAKRAKLNIAASRRLLFGSLGLRTPKTAAEEQALREQLAQNIGPGKTKRSKEWTRRETGSGDAKTASSKSWQDKLIVTAVECVQENLILPSPPFPFIQHWHRKDKTHEFQAGLTLNYDGAASPPSKCTDQVKSNGYMSHVPTTSGGGQQDETVISESRTLSSEKESDDKPIPTNFEDLPDLDRSQALPGTVIAYKEIHVGADTNFQPQVSAYRVAEIESMDKDGWVTMRLSKQDRRKNIPLDPDTGQKISNNFEIEGSQDEVDDGVRAMSWSFLLEPKLVQASWVQVPESAAQDSLGDEDGEEASQQKGDAVVPESLNVNHKGPKRRDITADAVQIEISTPRRKEIAKVIKEAGFDSAMDQDLIRPLLGDRDEPDDGSPELSTGQADSMVETSRVAIEETGADGWISSPLQHRDADMESNKISEPWSSPPASLQLSVEYPHVSHLEHGESSTRRDGYARNSSSHQDAQRVAPVPPSKLEFTDPPGHEVDGAVSEGANMQAEDSLEPLPSRGPTTQSQDESEEEIGNLSFLGRHGSDGQDSSYRKSDGESDGPSSDSSLPSLRALTASQKPKMMWSRKKQTGVNFTKPRKSRALSRTQASEASAGDAAEDVGIEQPAPSQHAIKISASQAEQQISFSQIPVGTQVVDLTLTSSPVSPGNSDGEFHPNGLARATSGENAGKRQTRASSGAIDDQAGIGMGTKRFLTTRKKRIKGDGGYF